MKNDIDIKDILETNLKDYVSKEIDKIIDEEVSNFRRKIEINKDNYIAHLMKNIRILHEYNYTNNKIDYVITFINEYKVGDKDEL